MIFVDAFHGGLLGDPSVQRIVATFLAGGTPSDQDLDAMAGGSQRDLRSAASLIAAVRLNREEIKSSPSVNSKITHGIRLAEMIQSRLRG